MSKQEIKSIQLKFQDNDFKFEESTESEAGMFSGYLACFDNVDSYGDVIEYGSFAKSLKQWQKKGFYPPILEQHGGWGMSAPDMTPVGKWVEMREDEKGLYVKGQLFPTTRGKDLRIILTNSEPGAIGMSIGFYPVKWETVNRGKADAKGCRRRLKEIDLREGSIVTFPANDKSRVTEAKSEMKTIREVERILRNECELSQTKATEVLAKIKDLVWGDEYTSDIEDMKTDAVEPSEAKTEDVTPKAVIDTLEDSLISAIQGVAAKMRSDIEQHKKALALDETLSKLRKSAGL